MRFIKAMDLYKFFDGGNEFARLHVSDIDALPSVDIAEWISVENRLPAEKGKYLTAYHYIYYGGKVSKSLEIDFDSFRGGNLKLWAKHKKHLVTHWMPIPEPPIIEKEYIKEMVGS